MRVAQFQGISIIKMYRKWIFYFVSPCKGVLNATNFIFRTEHSIIHINNIQNFMTLRMRLRELLSMDRRQTYKSNKISTFSTTLKSAKNTQKFESTLKRKQTVTCMGNYRVSSGEKCLHIFKRTLRPPKKQDSKTKYSKTSLFMLLL